MAKLWSGRFESSSAKLLDEFNASLPFDRKLYKQDIKGSIAHAKMLNTQKILSEEDLEAVVNGLSDIEKMIDEDRFTFDISDEDIHMAIETKLIELIGDAGKRLHTARSRNDQVATDFRLFVQEKNINIRNLLKDLMKVLLDISKKHTDTMLPGMTHLQHAQPVNLAFHLCAYLSMFKRDFERFESSYERNDVLPLGCAALAGTPHNIDRELTKEFLGFKTVSINCLDTVSDRDFALEMLFNISVLMMHISRISEELVIWSSSEFGYVTLSDEYSTGSSIMPQKKNPDVPELLRGKSGRVYGNLVSLLTVMKALPLAYNKDTQEDKEGVFDSVETVEISLKILSKALETLTVNSKNMLKACKVGHLSATDLADYLVQDLGVAFREAHHITGRAVALCEKEGIDLSEVSIEQLRSIDGRIGEEVLKHLSLRNSMNARDSQGGTSTKRTKEQLEYFQKWLEE